MAQKAQGFSHPLKPDSEMVSARRDTLTWLSRTGMNWIRVSVGKASLVYHSHHTDEM